MYKATIKNILFPLLTFLLVISLGFVNNAEASNWDESITNEEEISFTTEVINPLEGKIQPAYISLTYYFKGSFINTLYTAKTLSVGSGGSFYFDMQISSKYSSGFVNVTVQRKTLFGYEDIKTFTYTPSLTGTRAYQTLHNLKAGEYRLKMVRTNSLSTAVDGHIKSY